MHRSRALERFGGKDAWAGGRYVHFGPGRLRRGIGGTTSNAIGSRPPTTVALIVRRGMVVSESTRGKVAAVGGESVRDFVPFVAVDSQPLHPHAGAGA
jgi:hypothetical protein